MVDDPTHGYTNPRYGIPLVKQRYHGRLIHPNPPAPYYGGRLIHNFFMVVIGLDDIGHLIHL